jgi:hypothetical protein
MPPGVDGMTGWEVFDAVLTPDDLILLMSWRTRDNAESFEKTAKLPSDARLRSVCIVRDYGMLDRREAPQYYPASSAWLMARDGGFIAWWDWDFPDRSVVNCFSMGAQSARPMVLSCLASWRRTRPELAKSISRRASLTRTTL